MSTPVWKKRRVVKTGRPTQRSSPAAIAMMSDENDISETSKSPNFNCRQKSSDACNRARDELDAVRLHSPVVDSPTSWDWRCHAYAKLNVHLVMPPPADPGLQA